MLPMVQRGRLSGYTESRIEMCFLSNVQLSLEAYDGELINTANHESGFD